MPRPPKTNSLIEIIPAINVPTFEEVQERIKKVESHVEWAHLDVTDGVFSKHLTWHNPSDILLLDTKLSLEVHLMVENPEKVIDQWLIKPIRRVVFHLEAAKDPDFIINKCKKEGVEVGLAINPDTFWGQYKLWIDKVDTLLVLAVDPGPPGQEMKEGVLDKVRHLRQYCSRCNIEIDGGMNFETIKKAAEAGANLFVSGLAFKYPDPAEIIKKLKAGVKNK